MHITDAAARWARTWEDAWPRGDAGTIAALYAPGCTYRALAFREPSRGIEGARRYLEENFMAEREVTCRFGTPVAGPDRAAVEWWASWVEEERTLTMAGVTLLRFDAAGLVIDHRDYWNDVDGRHEPYARWSGEPG